MVRHTLKILQQMLQDFWSLSDHFGTSCIKGLINSFEFLYLLWPKFDNDPKVYISLIRKNHTPFLIEFASNLNLHATGSVFFFVCLSSPAIFLSSFIPSGDFFTVIPLISWISKSSSSSSSISLIDGLSFDGSGLRMLFGERSGDNF